MAFELARALAATERNDSFHIARLLLLMSAHAHGRDKNKSIDGLTKLAKLDFLLRYPNCLERALKACNRSIDEAKVKEFERTTIESKMIRFRYGPWDHRYRRWVALMAAKSLIVVGVVGKTVHIWLTDEGHDIASILSNTDSYKILAERAAVVERRFGGRSGTGLKDLIYETFPELINMKWGEEIVL